MWSKPQRIGTIFYWRNWYLETPNNFHLAVRGGLRSMEWLKTEAENGFIFHAIIPALYSFWWKFYSLSYRTFIFLNLDYGKTNSNQNVKVEKMVVFVKTFGYHHHMFNFNDFFSCPIKLQKNLKLKFRSKFNHGFTIIVAF